MENIKLSNIKVGVTKGFKMILPFKEEYADKGSFLSQKAYELLCEGIEKEKYVSEVCIDFKLVFVTDDEAKENNYKSLNIETSIEDHEIDSEAGFCYIRDTTSWLDTRFLQCLDTDKDEDRLIPILSRLDQISTDENRIQYVTMILKILSKNWKYKKFILETIKSFKGEFFNEIYNNLVG